MEESGLRTPAVHFLETARRDAGNLAIHCQEETKPGGHLASAVLALKLWTAGGGQVCLAPGHRPAVSPFCPSWVIYSSTPSMVSPGE